jgi:hypothetical protein
MSVSPADYDAIPEPDNPDEDRYPTPKAAFAAIADELDDFEGPVERIEVWFLAGGDATYRVYPARAEEPLGGYLPQVEG